MRNCCRSAHRYGTLAPHWPFAVQGETMKSHLKVAVLLSFLIALAGTEVKVAAAVCSVSSSGVAFGNYDSIGNVLRDTSGTISVTCSGSVGEVVNYTIALNGPTGRSLLAGGNQLAYN